MNKIQEFKDIVNQMAQTYEQKNSNYGDSFGKLFDELGPMAGLVPLYNKLHRASSLVQGDNNHFESLEDTFIDMACYAIMNVIEMRRVEKDTITAIPTTSPIVGIPDLSTQTISGEIYVNNITGIATRAQDINVSYTVSNQKEN